MAARYDYKVVDAGISSRQDLEEMLNKYAADDWEPSFGFDLGPAKWVVFRKEKKAT